MIPAPTLPVSLTAAELRALAALHDDFADKAGLCDEWALAQESESRAEHLRHLAVTLGPQPGDDDSLLSLGVLP